MLALKNARFPGSWCCTRIYEIASWYGTYLGLVESILDSSDRRDACGEAVSRFLGLGFSLNQYDEKERAALVSHALCLAFREYRVEDCSTPTLLLPKVPTKLVLPAVVLALALY